MRTSSELPVLREHSEPACLPLATHYRQVGVVHLPHGSMRGELRQRIGEAWASFRQGRKKIYRNQTMQLASRVSLLRSLVFSRLFYASGSWPRLKLGEGRMLHGAVTSMLKQVAGPRRGQEQRLHLCELCARAGVPPPAVLLHIERLRYLRLLVSHALRPCGRL